VGRGENAGAASPGSSGAAGGGPAVRPLRLPGSGSSSGVQRAMPHCGFLYPLGDCSD